MSHRKEAWADGGMKSRKMWVTVFAVGILFWGMVYAMSHPAGVGLYDAFVGGVVGLVSAFVVGNVGAKFVATKVPATKEVLKDDPPAAKPPQD